MRFMTDHQSYYRKDCISPSHNTANIRYAIREVTVLARRLETAGKRFL